MPPRCSSFSRYQFAFVLLLLACGVAHAEVPALQQASVLGGKVKILLPSDFKPMNEALLLFKYPRGKPPGLAYTNERATINVAFEHTGQEASAKILAQARAQMSATYRSIFPSAEWFRDELREINGRPFVLLELRTPAIDTWVRNIIVATILDGRVLLVSFNVTRELEGQWLATGNRIIESIVLE